MKQLFVFSIFMTSYVLLACSSYTTEISEENLQGKWHVVDFKTSLTSTNLAERVKKNALLIGYEFLENGVVVFTDDSYPFGTKGVWDLSEDQKKIHISMDDFIMIRDFDIVSFEQNRLVLYHDNSNFSKDTYVLERK